MRHHTRNDEAIVLKSKNISEADKLFWVLSKNFGLLLLRAKGIRLEQSKLRYSMQKFNLIEISFVNGKSGLRLTGAILRFSFEEYENYKNFMVLYNLTDLLSKLLPQNEPNIEIYNLLKKIIEQFDKSISKEDELIVVARILFYLGYLDLERNIKTDYIKNKEEYQKLLIRVNKAIKNTNLILE